MNAQQKTMALVLGGIFSASIVAAPAVRAADNPFAIKSLASGYMVAEADQAADGEKMKDGKCSTGKCSASKKKAMKEKAKEGNCRAEMKDKEGNCSAEMKAKADKVKEGNCSAEMKAKEGNCSASKH